MSTRNELLNGADFEGFEGLCDTIANMFKNNWRQSDPQTALTEAQPGMIASDEDDEKLYHKLGAGGPVSGACQPSGSPEWDEVLQARMSCTTTPVFNSVDLGDNNVDTSTKARAYLGSNQLNINDGVWTKILLDNEVYDPGGNFDLGNSKFVTPVPGFYLIVGQVFYTAASVIADKVYWTGVYINAALVAASPGHASLAAAVGSPLSTIQYVAAGIDIELYTKHDAGANTPDVWGSSVTTFMDIHLLSI